MKSLAEALNLSGGSRIFLEADWPAPAQVKTLLTTRNGGVSQAPYYSLNLGLHVGDNADDVLQNRRIVEQQIGRPAAYLNQTHSTRVVTAADALQSLQDADALVDTEGTAACVVMTADCLPVLFCDKAGTVVAAAHAGWRGLAQGVLQNTVAAMKVPPQEIIAYLGAAISADAFEVGQDVWDAFCLPMLDAQRAFEAIGGDKYLADIYGLARLVLQRAGVGGVYGGTRCTVLERDAFFSYRRDGQTGRMASLIWLEK